MSEIKTLTVLGATGSIGQSTLDVVARHPSRFRIHALTGRTRLELLATQCARFGACFAVVADDAAAAQLSKQLHANGADTQVLVGDAQLSTVSQAPEVDAVMAAIVGAAGLRPTLAAARAGKRVLLANKEALVMAGSLFMEAVSKGGAELLPIDSEHNAVFQSLPAGYNRAPAAAGVSRVLLTASGGPFIDRDVGTLADVTPEEACAHPNWSMGRKISVDSATMMNKGLEVIEAHWLFGATAEQIDIVVHRQSVIHSMVEYVDGSVIAQLGNPDMRTPIAHALAHPARIASGVSSLDLCRIGRLDFEPPDMQRFPCLALAYAALRASAGMPTVLNAANEVAVAAFLERRISYLAIARTIESVMSAMSGAGCASLEEIEVVDSEARRRAYALIADRKVA